MFVHHQCRSGLVVQVVRGSLVVCFQREVCLSSAYCPVQARCCLPSVLGAYLSVAQLPAVDGGDGRSVRYEVYVLAHRIEAGLQRKVVTEGILAREPQFGIGVEF